jgi:hypothetical protein
MTPWKYGTKPLGVVRLLILSEFLVWREKRIMMAGEKLECPRVPFMILLQKRLIWMVEVINIEGDTPITYLTKKYGSLFVL